jgi:signal transduction histidine kinase
LNKGITLQSKLRAQTIKWVLIALAFSLILSTSISVYFALNAEALRIKTLAQSVTRSFRPKILNDDVKDAQTQIESVLALSQNEYAVVRDQQMHVLYAPSEKDYLPSCKMPGTPCWEHTKGYVTYLQPIYFNDELKDAVFGYLELHLKTQYNKTSLIFVAMTLFLVFAMLVFGMSSAQSQTLKLLRGTIDDWAMHLRESLTKPSVDRKIPFQEFTQLADAIYTIHARVEKLQADAAREARATTKLTLFRGISHDLKTPVSQARKFFEAHLSKLDRLGKADPEVVDQIRRSLEKVSTLIRQVGDASRPTQMNLRPSETIDIADEVRTYIRDLKAETLFENHDIDIKLDLTSEGVSAPISKVQFYRMIDNLIRNAIDFLPSRDGKIEVVLDYPNFIPTLSIEDNGAGIRQEDLEKIFEVDFTTKEVRGTGLGLSIVKQICENAGANISVTSQLGVGTKFKIEFLAETRVNINKGDLAHQKEIVV